MVIFGDSITKLIVPHQTIKCNEHEATNFSQSGAMMNDIYSQVEHFKSNHKESKSKNIVILVRKYHIQRENPRDSSRKICKLLQKVKSDFQDEEEEEIYFSKQ